MLTLAANIAAKSNS